jgi:hypothetical protein
MVGLAAIWSSEGMGKFLKREEDEKYCQSIDNIFI